MKILDNRKKFLWLIVTTTLFVMLMPDLGFIDRYDNVVSGVDLIIGDDTPSEKLLVENTTYHHYGNVYLINQGEIEVKNGEFRVYGNIWTLHDSRISVNHSTFGFLSVTKWQFSINLYNDSELRVENSYIYSNLFANLLNPNDNSNVIFYNVTFTDWFSCKIADNSNIDVRDSFGPKGWASEFFFMDSATGYFSNITGIINVFCVFHAGSIIDYSPFWNENITHFEFPADVLFSFWVNYSFVIDNCFIYGNSPLLEKGCDVTVRNCITSVIIRPTNDDQLTISGLTANTYQSDWNAPLSDRQFRAINSFIRNWHLHIFDYSSVNLVNSIFSEILCIYWNCTLYMKNTIYKGDAGPFWVFGESTVFAENCVFFAQDPWGLNPVVYVRDLGTLALYNCYVYTDFTIEGYATVYLLNSETFREPLLLGSSVLWVAKINSPPTGLSNDSVPIRGSAYIDKAPAAITNFGSYRLYYAPPPSYTVFTPIGPERTIPVEDGVLEHWNTSFLTPGIYYLRMDLKDSNLTDNVSVYWVINIQRSDVLHHVPSEPQSLNAIENSGRVELTWSPPSSDGNASITNYAIYRGLSMGSLAQIAEIGNQTQYVDENVTPGTTYFYKVSAINKMGEGPFSDFAIITMNPMVDLFLSTTDITFSNSTPMEGQSVIIYGNIQATNLAKTETVWVELEIDGIPKEVKPLTISSSSTQIQFDWIAEEGNHDITMIVDIINSVDELNEGNNTATKQITVSEEIKPDLSIDYDSIEFSNNSPYENDMVTINATIHASYLTETLPVIVELLIDNKFQTYSNINVSSADIIISFNWTAEEGDHDITVIVDSINDVLESDESNNVATKQINVLEEPLPDFTIENEDIEFSNNEPFNGDVIWINATIHTQNLTDNMSCLVELLVNDELKDFQSVLISSTDTVVSFSWTCEPGDHTFTIVLDPENDVAESNEMDNHVTKELTVLKRAEPDITIRDIHIVQTTFNESDVIDIGATIHSFNLTGDVVLRVEFLVDDNLVAYKSLTISNGSTDVLFNWTAEKGEHDLEIKIDTTNTVNETNELNNVASTNVYISTQTIEPSDKEWEVPWPLVIIALLFLLIGPLIGLLLGMWARNKKNQKKESYK